MRDIDNRIRGFHAGRLFTEWKLAEETEMVREKMAEEQRRRDEKVAR
jgi:hypothetical protein